MRAVIGMLVGVGCGAGLWLFVAGLRRTPVRSARVPRPAWTPALRRSVIAAVAGVVMLACTGWPAAGLLTVAAAWVVPMLVAARRERQVVNERSEALAAWAEMLRDTITAHAGLREAIALTAPVAPRAVRVHVQALAVRAERLSLTEALERFGAEVADPVADLIVAALRIAADRQAHRLPELLSQIASAAREQSTMRLRVETGRARTYASARALVVITLGLATGLLVFSPTFMAPYDRATGQMVLMVVGLLFAGALAGLVAMSRPALPPRLFATDEGGRS